jgi:hypothetical protein
MHRWNSYIPHVDRKFINQTFPNLFRRIVQCLCVHPPRNFGCRTRSHRLTLDVVLPVGWQRLVAAQYGRSQRFNWKSTKNMVSSSAKCDCNITATNLSKFVHFMLGIRYVLGNLGIEPRWRRDFSHPSRPALWPTQSHIPRVPGLSLSRVTRPGRGVDQPPPSTAKVKERAELHPFSTLGLRDLF